MDYYCIANILAFVERGGWYMCTETIITCARLQSTIDINTVNIETSYTELLLVISHTIIVQSWEYTIYMHHT